MVELTQRTASLGDLKGIWGLLKQVAADIPFELESEAAQESVLSELMVCCTSGLSPVVIGEDKEIVGAALVRRDDFQWGFRNGAAVQMSYAEIAPAYRDQGVLRAFVDAVQKRKVPVFVRVRSGNQFGLADGFKELGFTLDAAAANDSGDLYKWQPSPVA
jgi:ribosomal protein S18 acetylase RimI-like enzyme